MSEPLPERARILLGKLLENMPSVAENRVLREGMLRLILSMDYQAARDAVEKALRDHEVLSSPELVYDVLEGMVRRRARLWKAWLAPITAESCSSEQHQLLLDEVATKTLEESVREATDDQPILPDDEIDEICRLVSALRPEDRPAPDGLEGALASLFAVVTDQAVLDRQVFILRRLCRVATALGVSLRPLEESVAQVFAAQLARATPAPLVPELVKYLDEAVDLLVPQFSKEFGTTLLDQMGASPWLAELHSAQLRMAISGALAKVDPGAPSPLDAAGVAAVVANHGDGADLLCAHWIDGFRPDPEALAIALAAFAQTGPPVEVARALEGRAAACEPGERVSIVRGFIRGALETPLDSKFLRAGMFHESDQLDAANEIASLFTTASNDDERTKVLAIWEALRPTDRRAREALIDQIYVPMLKSGRAGFMLAYKNLHLVLPSSGPIGERVKRALLEEAERYGDYKRRVQRKLYDAGMIERSGGVFRDLFRFLDS